MGQNLGSLSWDDNTFQEALDSLSVYVTDTNQSSKEYDLNSIEEHDVTSSFKKALSDYKRIIKRCEYEGLEITEDPDSYQQEYFDSSPSISKRLEIIAELREQILLMIDSCEKPPKDIIRRYSEDLVTRIEDGVMDGFEVDSDDDY